VIIHISPFILDSLNWSSKKPKCFRRMVASQYWIVLISFAEFLCCYWFSYDYIVENNASLKYMLGNCLPTKIPIFSGYTNHLSKKYLLIILRLKLGAAQKIKNLNCCCCHRLLIKFDVYLLHLLFKPKRRPEWISVETYHFFLQTVTLK